MMQLTWKNIIFAFICVTLLIALMYIKREPEYTEQ
jgi:hypothetical protein